MPAYPCSFCALGKPLSLNNVPCILRSTRACSMAPLSSWTQQVFSALPPSHSHVAILSSLGLFLNFQAYSGFFSDDPLSLPSISPTIQRPHIPHQPPLPPLTPNRHLQLVKWVLHHIIRIQLIYLSHNLIYIRLLRFRE